MKVLKNLKNFMLYAGLEEDQWKKVQPLVAAENAGKLLLAAIVAAMYYGICLIGSYRVQEMADKQLVYLFGTIMPIIVLALHESLTKGKRLAQNGLIAFFSFCILASGLLSTLICTPDEMTVILLIFFFCIGMLFVWHPGALIGVVLLTDLLFYVFAPLCKVPEVLVIDMIDVGAFSTLSLVLSVSLIRERYRRYWLEFSANELAELRFNAAYRDLLTNVFNRSAYEKKLEAMQVSEPEADLAYLALDVNGLKQANDTLGHMAGDQLIIGVAECLRSSFQDLGSIFRVGGDEFAVILHAGEEQRQNALAEFEKRLAEWPADDGLVLSVSYGLVGGEEVKGMTLKEIIALADRRMYLAKANYYRSKGIDRRDKRGLDPFLGALYLKVLRVNLTEDTYSILYMDPEEVRPNPVTSSSFSAWRKEFAADLQVYAPDLAEFHEKMSREFLMEHFRQGGTKLQAKYRRKVKGEYYPVVAEIIPAGDYSDAEQTLFLTVKKAEEEGEC